MFKQNIPSSSPQRRSGKTADTRKATGVQPKTLGSPSVEKRVAPPVYRPTTVAAQSKLRTQTLPSSVLTSKFQLETRSAPPVYRPAPASAQAQPSSALKISRVYVAGSDLLQTKPKGRTLAKKNQQRIRRNKIASGQHGITWVPSGSAGGVRAVVAQVETKQDAIARLTADVVRFEATEDHPARLAKAIHKRIDDAEGSYGADDTWDVLRGRLNADE
jgi:hypothetical protein